MKKFLAILLSLVSAAALLGGCKKDDNSTVTPPPQDTETTTPGETPPETENPSEPETPPEEVKPPQTVISPLSKEIKDNLSAGGFVKGKISDFSEYEGTSAYRKVKTADEFIAAIADAKYHYDNVWNNEDGTYTQVPKEGYTQDNFKGTVKVIEIENDLNLGYKVLSSAAKATGLATDFASKANNLVNYLPMSDMFTENGISQIKIENTSNLLIYSKNGAKLTHCGFKLTSDTNVVFRNLQFDEMWQWEDGLTKSAGKIGDYDWFGWAYFKISFCGYIWIDHCSFGKSYDGQIDYSNPDYTANAGVAFRAPYGADGGNGLHISFCNFNAGSDDENGYLYKMMKKIEDEYQAGGENYLYYNALRKAGASFEDILYGVAIPQKKGFLCGDSGNNKEDYDYNLKLNISFADCLFKNIEDRLPKLRGGNAFMYNCVVDASQYFGYRKKLKNINAAGAVSAVNSGWKCALVSQGILCGNGGSVKAENCIFKGIESLLKNNDTQSGEKDVNGGYMLVNCSYKKDATNMEYIGSSSDTGNRFENSTPTKLKTEYFSWHNQTNTQPFEISKIALSDIETLISNADYGAGTNDKFNELFLKITY